MARDKRSAEVLDTRSVFTGRVVELSVDRVRLPNSSITQVEVVHHRGAAAVLPLLPDGDVLLVRQFRYPTGGWLLEIPAGTIDGAESPRACANRELQEETGFSARRLVPLGWIWTTPGFTDEKIWLFLATGLEPATQSLEADEVLAVERFSLEQAVEMAAHGEIHDGKSVCALLRAARWLAEGLPSADEAALPG